MFQRYFVQQGRFTAGVATRYGPSMITAEPTFQRLATGFPVGMRFHSAPVVHLADATLAAHDELNDFFAGVLVERSDPAMSSARTMRLTTEGTTTGRPASEERHP